MAKKSTSSASNAVAAAHHGAIARFTDARFASAVKKMHARLATDRDYAIKILHDAGIVTKQGNLTKRYRD